MATTPRCCGHDMREIPIGVPDPVGLLVFICDVCRRNEWRRNGVPVTAAEALDTAIELDRALGRAR